MSVDALTVERWVGEGIIKCAHIVLSSRVYRCSRTLPPRSRSNWFKLEVEEVDDASQELAKYRHDVSRPLVIQIIQVPDGPSESETVFEQWQMQFDGVPPTHHLRTVSYDDEPTKIYKRMCVMARTLYSYVRVLPAYRLYRACRDHRGAARNLSYRLLHTNAPVLQPAEGHRSDGGTPRPHVERFAFAPIETMTGSLQISVQYQPQVVPLMSTAAARVSIPQHVITDYIRTPHHGERAVNRTLSASAAPILSSAAAAAGAVGSATAAGLSLLSRAYQGAMRDPALQRAGSNPGQVDILSTHAEEQEGDRGLGCDAEPAAASTSEEQPRCPTSTRAHPTAIPARRPPVLVPTHPCSAPSDFSFARQSPAQGCSPYTRHLASHVKSHHDLPPLGHADAWFQRPIPRSPHDRASPSPSPLHRASASSSASQSAASASCSSPMAGSPASQGGVHIEGATCRALVKRASGRAGRPMVAPGARGRQVVVQLDSSLESCRLFSSPDGLLRASSGRSDVLGSRWGSPGGGTGAEWGSFQRQRLIEHPDSNQTTRETPRGEGDIQELRESFDGSAGDAGAAPRSRISTESSQGSGEVFGGPSAVPESKAEGRGVQRQRSKLGSLVKTDAPHDLAASAPLLPGAPTRATREAEIKDFLLQLEQPVQFGPVCGQDHSKTLLDVQMSAESIMSRWGMMSS